MLQPITTLQNVKRRNEGVVDVQESGVKIDRGLYKSEAKNADGKTDVSRNGRLIGLIENVDQHRGAEG